MSGFESAMGEFNSLVFWPEFTFIESRFKPTPDKNAELADNVIWYGDRAFVVQMKEREKPSPDPESEKKWFRKRVLDEATKQIRDSLEYLEKNEQIEVANLANHKWNIKKAEIKHITKIIIYSPAINIPDDCRNIRFHFSKTAGFIHIINAVDYLAILENFSVPEDFRQYLLYREQSVPALRTSGVAVEERDIIGAYIQEQKLPTPRSHEILNRLVLDMPLQNFQQMLTKLRDHILYTSDPYSYYKILQHFATVPRSVWREVEYRFSLALDAAERGQPFMPTRVIDPSRDLTFMVAALDPSLPGIGTVGQQLRC